MTHFTYGKVNSGHYLLERFASSAGAFEGALEIAPEEARSVITLLNWQLSASSLKAEHAELEHLTRIYMDTRSEVVYDERQPLTATAADLALLQERVDELWRGAENLQGRVRILRIDLPERQAAAYPELQKAVRRFFEWAQGLPGVAVPAELESDLLAALSGKR